MNRSTYFLVAGGALAGVIFVAACIFVFVAGAYRPPAAATATPRAAAAEPTATRNSSLPATQTMTAAASDAGTGTPGPVTVTPEAGQATTQPATQAATSSTSADTPAAAGDPERGRVIFSAGHDQAPPCSGCHATVKVGRGFAVGPNLSSVADRAGTRIEGLSAEAYLRQSILQPRAFVVPGYRDMMYPGYAQVFSDGDVADIVAYLLTLHADEASASQ